eukprot:965073-Karenia_brevis.AAC.1
MEAAGGGSVVAGRDQFQSGHRGVDVGMTAASGDGSVVAGRNQFQCSHQEADVNTGAMSSFAAAM